MKRPWLIWTLVIAHGLFAGACAVGLWLILHEVLKPAIVAEGSDTVQGLYIGAAGAAGCALLYGLIATGLWFRRKWMWWLGIVVNGAFGGAILLDPLTERNWDWEDIWLGLFFVAILAVLVLPPVRKFMSRKEPAVTALTTAAESKT